MSQYMSIKDVAEWLNVDYKTIYRLIRQDELPAAKVGGVYRINKADVEQYIGQSSRASTPATSVQTPPVLKCNICQRLLHNVDEVGGYCAHPHCTAEICTTCWKVDEREYCVQHQPSHADLLRAAQTQIADGVTQLLIAPEARRREQNYITRFDTKVQRITKLWHPLRQQVITPPRPWEELHLETDAVEMLMNLLHTGFLNENLEREMPLNVASRYTVPSLEEQPGMILEARALSDLPALVKQGFVTEPLGVAALTPALEQCVRLAEAQSVAYLIGLAATSGWTAEAVTTIAANEAGRAFYHPRVLPCLIDLDSFAVTFNTQDERITPLASLFKPRLPEEELKHVIEWIERELQHSHGVSITELLAQSEIDAPLAQRAFAHLVAQGTHRVEVFPEIGEVIARIAV